MKRNHIHIVMSFLLGIIVASAFHTLGARPAAKPPLPAAVKLDPDTLQVGAKMYEDGKLLGLISNPLSKEGTEVIVQYPNGLGRVLRRFDVLTSGRYQVEP